MTTTDPTIGQTPKTDSSAGGTNPSIPQKPKTKTEKDLDEMKVKYLEEIKILLANKEKKEVKALQAKAEEMRAEYEQSVAAYKKARIRELEQELRIKEEEDLTDIENQLNNL